MEKKSTDDINQVAQQHRVSDLTNEPGNWYKYTKEKEKSFPLRKFAASIKERQLAVLCL